MDLNMQPALNRCSLKSASSINLVNKTSYEIISRKTSMIKIKSLSDDHEKNENISKEYLENFKIKKLVENDRKLKESCQQPFVQSYDENFSLIENKLELSLIKSEFLRNDQNFCQQVSSNEIQGSNSKTVITEEKFEKPLYDFSNEFDKEFPMIKMSLEEISNLFSDKKDDILNDLNDQKDTLNEPKFY